jgi:predicted dehydrogenase
MTNGQSLPVSGKDHTASTTDAAGTKIWKGALIGIGFMGRVHLAQYQRMEREGAPVRLQAICDIDARKFDNVFVEGNLNESFERIDFSPYRLYTDIGELLEREELDFVDIALPTDLHAATAIRAMERGLHVLCEKPMALGADEASAMAQTSARTGTTLMVAQVLRFWPAYEYLKNCTEQRRYGDTLAATFFRGGDTPVWSHDNWMLREARSGGSLLDQHVHDVDLINWLYGQPESVSCVGRNVLPGSGYDIVSTHYRYADGKVVLAQDDWTLKGAFGFEMSYRVNFERGCLVFEHGILTDYPAEGEAIKPELDEDAGFYRELRYFVEILSAGDEPERCMPADTLGTIRIAEAELASARKQGEWVAVSI